MEHDQPSILTVLNVIVLSMQMCTCNILGLHNKLKMNIRWNRCRQQSMVRHVILLACVIMVCTIVINLTPAKHWRNVNDVKGHPVYIHHEEVIELNQHGPSGSRNSMYVEDRVFWSDYAEQTVPKGKQ